MAMASAAPAGEAVLGWQLLDTTATKAASLAPTATPSEEGSTKSESVTAESAEAQDTFLQELFADSGDEEEDLQLATVSKSARRRLRRKRQREGVRAAALQKSLEACSERTAASDKVVTLSDIGLDICCTPSSATRVCPQTPQGAPSSLFGCRLAQAISQDAGVAGGYRPVPAPINPLAPPQSPHFTGSSLTTPQLFNAGVSPQQGCMSTSTASTFVPMSPACSSAPSSLCRKLPGGPLEVIGTSPCHGTVVRGDASNRASLPGTGMSPLSPAAFCTPMSPVLGQSLVSSRKPPSLPPRPYAPLTTQIPRPWLTGAPPSAYYQAATAATPASHSSEVLRLLLGDAGAAAQHLVTASRDELLARLQAATPEVYED
eukprot:TRINITY_DN28850_c0_g2_i3.p1 TRINITY_DN28850_c0_g2~~TRINITY_DN28850_c0_g2_i3.p1  ORF type:complete len:374 (+),score=60.72 TRINITY_DN28850_c0_g2_i3:108-1229(+)